MVSCLSTSTYVCSRHKHFLICQDHLNPRTILPSNATTWQENQYMIMINYYTWVKKRYIQSLIQHLGMDPLTLEKAHPYPKSNPIQTHPYPQHNEPSLLMSQQKKNKNPSLRPKYIISPFNLDPFRILIFSQWAQ